MEKREAAVVIEAVSHHLGWCGCGAPWAAADWLRRALEAHPAWEKESQQGAVWGEGHGRAYVLRYMLDHAALTEHGGSVGGAWLTERGERVLAALQVPGAIEEWSESHDLYEEAEAITDHWRGWGHGGPDCTRF
ncbi:MULTISPECIES: hypothetical protein [unclassified Methylobacterium]|uniref:hypothetical protein n=1 Tax=unclassified Methylobacterium TaxID=2615210 RepID=UPI0011C1F048|nr:MULTISPECIES: hypothetical protein [unclassified Methylobacterium]QEE39814.1 hypothetical protein FVA80_13495 [Methylobacterium sp. WL1]TXN57342.1 hypothetical protein FV241_11815 [Methylobacterium sp. WL2]